MHFCKSSCRVKILSGDTRMSDADILLLQKVLLFAVTFGAALLSFVVSVLVGPARNFVGPAIKLVTDGEFEFSEGRKHPRRPRRTHLTDPDKAPKALQSYRTRAQTAIDNSQKILQQIGWAAAWRGLFLIAITFGASTFAYLSFILANNYLFGQGDATVHPQGSLSLALMMIVFDHVRLAYGFAPATQWVVTGGFATDIASQIYKLVLVWCMPVMAQQFKWIVFDLPKLWSESVRDLQRIAHLDDRTLLAELQPYIRETQASADGWFSSLWYWIVPLRERSKAREFARASI